MNALILIILALGAVALAAWWQENARAEVDDSYKTPPDHLRICRKA
ncbi:hypothetical protein [Cognatiyoonia sp.]